MTLLKSPKRKYTNALRYREHQQAVHETAQSGHLQSVDTFRAVKLQSYRQSRTKL